MCCAAGGVEVLDRAGEALRSFDVDDGAGIVRGGDGQAYVTLPAGDGMDVYALDAGKPSAVRLPQVTAAYPGSAECPLLCLRPEGLYWLRADGALEPAALWRAAAPPWAISATPRRWKTDASFCWTDSARGCWRRRNRGASVGGGRDAQARHGG